MNKKDNNNNYYNIMEKVAEQNYKNWGFPNSDYALLHVLNDNTYNYRGYYNKYPNGKGNAVDHWTDEFKTVYHPTFSKESKYSEKKSQYNPKGIKGGSWLFGKFFIPSKDQLMEYFKKGGGIHIKKENREKFTDYCGGKVTSECIAKGKKSPNAAIRKRATFAANARKWKHQTGGTLVETLGGGNTITAKQKAKSNLTKRKAPDWDNLDRGYRYLTQDMKLPHDQAIAIMGNVVEESQGDYKAAQKNGRGRGLIQWDGRPAPKGRYGQWGSIWASVAKPANVYDKATDTVKNYWGPYNGLKGEQVRQEFIKAPLKKKVEIYSNSYLRAGNPRNEARYLSAMQLDSIYNPKIKNVVIQQKVGGKIDFLSLGGWVKNTFNNVSSFLGSDTGKSVLSIGSGLIGLGKGISNSGKIADATNEAEEAINAQESADRQKSFAEKYATILQEKLSKPDIDVNGSPIHTNGVNVTNEAYNQAINTFNFDRTKYNQMRQQIKEQAYQAQGENSSSMIGSVGGLIDSIGGIAGSLLNKKSTAPKTSQVITGNPDSSKQVITTNSGMSGTVDDWRKAILG